MVRFRLAAVTLIKSGWNNASANKYEPHSGQNPRRTLAPLSPVTSYYFGSPVIFNASVGTRRTGAKALPVAR